MGSYVRRRLRSTSRANRVALVVGIAVLALHAGTATAQLRIVSYNTTGAPYPGMDIVLRSIGEEVRNGIAKPIDVLLLQETSRDAGLSDTQAFVDLLNSMYDGETFLGEPITYRRGTLIGNASFSGDSGQSVVYRAQTVSRRGEVAVGNVSGSGQPRQAIRYQLRPLGYESDADFYAYNAHFKAGTESMDPDNPVRRNIEAVNIRNNANGLGNAPIIYAGDFNLYTSAEPAFQTLIAPGNGQAFDPIDRIGSWNNNIGFADVHTQAPCSSSVGNCSSGGGMDDRFDFQLVTNELLDGEGLDYIPSSYRAFGNNGSTYNTSINNGNTITFAGVTSHSKSEILGALRTVSDHLPVVVDYQVPAMMEAILAELPSTFNIGEEAYAQVTVSNIANVVAAIGADELDYSITTAFGGAVSGSYFDEVALPLAAGNVHLLTLDTATAGLKTGTILVQSSSQAAQNAMIEIPVSYEVLALGLAGDFNDDGVVDAADYSVWRNHVGEEDESSLNNNGDGMGGVDAGDYALWKSQYGETSPGSGTGGFVGTANNAVPEPGGLLLLLVGCCLGSRRLATLRAWTRNA